MSRASLLSSSFVNCQPHKLGLDFGRFSFQLSTFNFNLYLGGYSAEVPPLPIPNRVVKLSIADGTALRCGRVGSRHFQKPRDSSRGFFVCVVGRGRHPLHHLRRLSSCMSVFSFSRSASLHENFRGRKISLFSSLSLLSFSLVVLCSSPLPSDDHKAD